MIFFPKITFLQQKLVFITRLTQLQPCGHATPTRCAKYTTPRQKITFCTKEHTSCTAQQRNSLPKHVFLTDRTHFSHKNVQEGVSSPTNEMLTKKLHILQENDCLEHRNTIFTGTSTKNDISTECSHFLPKNDLLTKRSRKKDFLMESDSHRTSIAARKSENVLKTSDDIF
mmetsp:Transcript_61371/g.73820  ORF Transcript_61371/g.73820 Transcript_61371/m.73820 type:complete len:171 (-) Transcript_61371:145-657(-)